MGRRVIFHGLLTFFGGFLLVWGEDCGFGDGWALSYNSLKFWDFPDLSKFPKNLSVKSFGNSFSNSYIPCLWLIITLRFTCGEKKKVKYQKASKYVHDCLQNFLLRFMFLLTAPIVKNGHVLAGIYFIFLKYVLDQT